MSLSILFATAEVFPFAKTGGLADFAGALPVELEKRGHKPILFLPAYRQAISCGQPIEPTGVGFPVRIGSKTVSGSLMKSTLPGSQVPVYLVQQDEYFDRPGMYGTAGRDFADNCERFVFFCRAVLEAIRILDLHIDVLHANDWYTGLLPAYLKTEFRGVHDYERIATLFTIHNLAYQGIFPEWDMLLTGLDWKYFNWEQMEFFSKLNLMKTGLVFADALNTVSPRYAEDIQIAPLGCNLEGVLNSRRDVLSGIVNGVDYGQWNPSTDPYLATQFNTNTFVEGKARCKAALQAEMGLPACPNVPLMSFVGRMVDQKGADLVASVLQDWVRTNEVQWAILGSGDPKYEQLFTTLARRHPQKVAVKCGFSEPLAHRIEAGADMFLMPSRFEPCGLHQLYSLKYGTVPIVRATGGLADTICNATPETIDTGTATGFSFRDCSTLALDDALTRACEAYEQPAVWSRLIKNGMSQDWSWSRAAGEYSALYFDLVAKRRQASTQFQDCMHGRK